jgi:uncharacterized protein YbjT (DUF2867 family)
MPINFISANDVAGFVELAVTNPTLRRSVVKAAGPENLTLNQIVQAVQAATATPGTVRHVPLPVMRVMSKLLSPIKPALAREVEAGVFLDTVDRKIVDRKITPTPTRDAYPSVPVTRLTDVIRQHAGTPKRSDA